MGFVEQTTRRLGLRGKAADDLDQAVEMVCRNVIENAFEPGEDGWYDVYVLRRPGQIVVTVEDRGLRATTPASRAARIRPWEGCYTARSPTRPVL